MWVNVGRRGWALTSGDASGLLGDGTLTGGEGRGLVGDARGLLGDEALTEGDGWMSGGDARGVLGDEALTGGDASMRGGDWRERQRARAGAEGAGGSVNRDHRGT